MQKGSITVRGSTSRAGRTLGRGKSAGIVKKVSNRIRGAYAQPYVAGRKSMSGFEMHEAWVKANIEKSILKKFLPLVAEAIEGAAAAGETTTAAEAATGAEAATASEAGAASEARKPSSGGSSNPSSNSSSSLSVNPGYGKAADLRQKTLIKEEETEKSLMQIQADLVKANISKSILNKTFVSQAQRRLFYAKQASGEISKKVVKEFESKTPKNKKLPEHVKKKG